MLTFSPKIMLESVEEQGCAVRVRSSRDHFCDDFTSAKTESYEISRISSAIPKLLFGQHSHDPMICLFLGFCHGTNPVESTAQAEFVVFLEYNTTHLTFIEVCSYVAWLEPQFLTLVTLCSCYNVVCQSTANDDSSTYWILRHPRVLQHFYSFP